MAERRKVRQSKSRGEGRTNPFADLPPSKLDWRATAEREEDAGNKNEPIRAANPTEAAEKAKALLKAQRDSVKMLTLVKERFDETISNASADGQNKVFDDLTTHGFAVIDSFLNDEDTLAQMVDEGKEMLVEGEMEVDTANLGTGEYITALQGGEKQYTVCPRMVELVVSSTKHVPAAFEGYDGDDNTLELDDSACMATLRAFDRKALKASLALLTGAEDDNVLDAADKSLKPVTSGADDQRRLSLFYYVLPEEWDEDCGGGLVFESGSVSAKRDRLVIFFSKSTKMRAIPWKGNDSSTAMTLGNSIEIHLVKKR